MGETLTSKHATRPNPSPLAAIHARLGGRLGGYRGHELPLSFGSEDEEYAALVADCGLFARPWFSIFEMGGEDRQRYLNGLVTCDVKDLRPGEGTYGFVTEVKGHVLADLGVLAEEERLLLRLPAGSDEALSEHLLKYVIVDRVELQPRRVLALTLHGARAEEVLAEALGREALPQNPWDHGRVNLGGQDLHLLREPLGGGVGWTLWAPWDAAESAYEAILSLGGRRVPKPVGASAWERLRVESGRPVFARDYGPANFPQETGMESAVSYTKGCYLGQEIIARIHYRGGVNKKLRGLRLSSDGSAALGRGIFHQGRQAGTLTSVHGELALSILHKRSAEAGTKVEVEGFGPAEVVDLPFPTD